MQQVSRYFSENPKNRVEHLTGKQNTMIITTDSGQVIDTADLSPEERHVIQKLLAWMTLVDSVDQFYPEKKQQAPGGRVERFRGLSGKPGPCLWSSGIWKNRSGSG